MTHVDMRKLSPAAQEERRRQAIGRRESGLTYEAVAAQTGLSKTGVLTICQRFAVAGMVGTTSQPQRLHGASRVRGPRQRRRAATPARTRV